MLYKSTSIHVMYIYILMYPFDLQSESYNYKCINFCYKCRMTFKNRGSAILGTLYSVR